jgi:hypothetical protein
MKIREVALGACCVVAWGTNGWAHPGHGDVEKQSSVTHYFVEPIHQAGWGGVVVAVVAATIVFWRLRRTDVTSTGK